jgi:hypothetical protein
MTIPEPPFVIDLPQQPIVMAGVPTGFAFEPRVRVLRTHLEDDITVVDECMVLDVSIVPAAPHAR